MVRGRWPGEANTQESVEKRITVMVCEVLILPCMVRDLSESISCQSCWTPCVAGRVADGDGEKPLDSERGKAGCCPL